MPRRRKAPRPAGLRKRTTKVQGDVLVSQMIRVDVNFAAALREVARLLTEREGRVVGVTEVTRRIANDPARMSHLFNAESAK